MDLPEGWTVRPLGDVAKVVGGGTPRRSQPEFYGGGIPWLTPSDIENTLIVREVSSSTETLSEEGLTSSSARILPSGTVIYSSRASIGKVAIGAVPLATNQGFANFIPHREIFNKYLAYALKWITPEVKAIAGQTTFPEIAKSAFKRLTIPVPPLEEQRRLVGSLEELLTRAQEACTLRESAIRDAAALMPMVLRDTLQQAGSDDWERVPLGVVAGIAAPLVDPLQPANQLLPHISGESIERTTGRLLSFRTAAEDGVISGKYHFLPGAVLYSKIRPYLRKACRVTFEGLCSADVYPLMSDETVLDPDYLLWVLLSDDFSEYAVAHSARARMPKLNRKQLFRYQVPLPPLDRQKEIVRIVEAVRETIDRLQSAQLATAPELERLATAILGVAFRGELKAP